MPLQASPKPDDPSEKGDQPLFDPDIVEDLAAPLLDEDALTHMATIKYRIPAGEEFNNPNQVKIATDNQGYALYFSRCPIPLPLLCDGLEGPGMHHKHLGFYAYRTNFLERFTRLKPEALESAEKLEQLRTLGYRFKTRGRETWHNSLAVDIPENIQVIEKAKRAVQATERRPYDL